MSAIAVHVEANTTESQPKGLTLSAAYAWFLTHGGTDIWPMLEESNEFKGYTGTVYVRASEEWDYADVREQAAEAVAELGWSNQVSRWPRLPSLKDGLGHITGTLELRKGKIVKSSTLGHALPVKAREGVFELKVTDLRKLSREVA